MKAVLLASVVSLAVGLGIGSLSPWKPFASADEALTFDAATISLDGDSAARQFCQRRFGTDTSLGDECRARQKAALPRLVALYSEAEGNRTVRTVANTCASEFFDGYDEMDIERAEKCINERLKR